MPDLLDSGSKEEDVFLSESSFDPDRNKLSESFVRPGLATRVQRAGVDWFRRLTVPLCRVSSRFENLILSHHSNFTCACMKQEINYNGNVGACSSTGRAGEQRRSRFQHLNYRYPKFRATILP